MSSSNNLPSYLDRPVSLWAVAAVWDRFRRAAWIAGQCVVYWLFVPRRRQPRRRLPGNPPSSGAVVERATWAAMSSVYCIVNIILINIGTAQHCIARQWLMNQLDPSFTTPSILFIRLNKAVYVFLFFLLFCSITTTLLLLLLLLLYTLRL